MSIQQVTVHNYREMITNNGKNAVLDFWAPWCGPCKAAAPIFEEVAQANQDKLFFGKVNVDEEQVLAADFSVSTIPTFILLRDGKEADRLVGLPSKKKLEDWISQ